MDQTAVEARRSVGNEPPAFDVGRLESPALSSALLDALLRYPVGQRILDVLRWIKPVWRIPFLEWTLVLRYEHVREVLSSSGEFQVPWGAKMKRVTSDDGAEPPNGRNFVLGMTEPDAHYRQDYALLAQAFAFGDVATTVSRLALEASETCLRDWQPTQQTPFFDVVERLVLSVPAMMCDTYYGIPIADPVHFGKCSLAVSSYLFGPPFEDDGKASTARKREMALAAAAPLRHTIRTAMREAEQSLMANGDNPADSSPLHRLMRAKRDSCGAIDDDRIHVQLFGMVLGFIPTNVLAAGNLLETLLDKPEFMLRTVQAARAGDDERLWRCLRETLRFRNINPGPWRLCAHDTLLANAHGRATRIRKGEQVLACTQAAMFDGRRITHPHLFDSNRPDEDYLVFGLGQHWCLGAYIAIAQITQMFKVLFTHFDVSPAPGAAGRMKRVSVFPLHQMVSLKPVAAPCGLASGAQPHSAQHGG
jgi:cytochrome P450